MPVKNAPEDSPARRIIEKFGGPYKMAEACGSHWSTVYRWLWMPPHGTGGQIPSSAVRRIVAAAALCGVVLTAEDWDPHPGEELI
jgi:hypothetical protein